MNQTAPDQLRPTGRLDGKAAIITGSTRGVGEATARLLAARGASVTVTGRSRERGEFVAKSIEADGGTALFLGADIGVHDEVRNLVEASAERFGRLDILINNAAPTEASAKQTVRMTEVPWDEFEDVMRIGLYGAVWATRFAIPHMQRAGGGSIVNISSLGALQGLPGMAAYTCAKGALGALTRQLAVDYAADGIRVNTVPLGIIVNELTRDLLSVPGMEEAVQALHLTRLGHDLDAARMIAYLASDDAGFLSGNEYRVDGGMSAKGLVPGEIVRTGFGADRLTGGGAYHD